MKLIFQTVLMILMACSCEKVEDFNQKNLFIRGRLFLNDTLFQKSVENALSNRVVKLAHKTLANSTDFIYSDSTDANGYFLFTILSSDAKQSFRVVFEDTIDGVHYSGSTDAMIGNDKIVVEAKLDETKQNGFVLTFVDSKNQNIANVNYQFYLNQSLADLNDTSGVDAAIKGSTDGFGIAYKVNIPSGNYVLNAQQKSDKIGYETEGKIIAIPKSGIMREKLQMQEANVIRKNGFDITVVDKYAGVVPRTNVNLFSSKALSLLNDSRVAIDSFVTDSFGKISRRNFMPGRYYLSASKLIDSLTFVSLGNEMQINENGVTSFTLVVKPLPK